MTGDSLKICDISLPESASQFIASTVIVFTESVMIATTSIISGF